MLNRLDVIIRIAEDIRFGVECSSDDALIECTEDTYVKGLSEDPDLVCCRILFEGFSTINSFIDVIYQKRSNLTDIDIGISNGCFNDADKACKIINDNLPYATPISRFYKGCLINEKVMNQLLDSHDIRRVFNIASFSDADFEKLCETTCGTKEVFDYDAVEKTISSIIGYGDFSEKSIPIPDSVRKRLFFEDSPLYDKLYNERNIDEIEDEQEKQVALTCLQEQIDLFKESSFCRNCTYEEFEFWLDEYMYHQAMDSIKRRMIVKKAMQHDSDSK